MASTGLVMLLFVVGHMAGNLKMFGGVAADGVYKIDHYAEFLQRIGQDVLGHGNFLWIARIVLLICLVLHFITALQLSRINARARPEGYRAQAYASANPASRSMLYGGLFILCFIIFHILHFTTGTVHFEGFVYGAVYKNVTQGFQVLPIAIFYVLAMASLALHLYHGTWSLFQTFGVDTPSWNGGLRAISKLTAVVLFFGFSSVPLAVLFGFLTPG